MDNDDVLIGRILSRREVLWLAGGAGVAALVGCSDNKPPAASKTAVSSSGLTQPTAAETAPATATAPSAATTGVLPACVVSPALTEGPYFVDEKLNRSDIRSEPATGAVKDGAALALTFQVSSVSGGQCSPLAGAAVDIWQCDALGVYSDASDPGFNTRGQKFLRGFQPTDASGRAQFTTVYPGWYPGRAVHIRSRTRSSRSRPTAPRDNATSATTTTASSASRMARP